MSALAATFAHLDAATDGRRLGRFVQARDADAFASLVRRLGPGVLAVCRRVCPDFHLAEDAFQAVFLVLARKAETVRPRERVAVWLHGVAYRTASKARAMLAARRRREVGSPDLPDPPADQAASDDDELRKLDAAIAALPDHLRAAVVLCELEGRSRKDAAKVLGIAEGTLSSRLADARKRLGRRLRPTVAVVTAALAARTAEAATSGSASETVLSLAKGATTMLLLKRLTVVALLALGVCVGSVFADPPADDKPRAKPPAAKEAKDELKWKLAKGDVFYLSMRGDGDYKMLLQPGIKINPNNQQIDNQQSRSTEVWKVTVTAADKDGLAMEAESVSCCTGKGNDNKQFETADVDGMAGKKFTATYDADRKLKKVSDGEALDKIADAARAKGLSVTTSDAMAHNLEQLFRLTPTTPPNKDGEWDWAVEYTDPDTQLVSTWTRRAKLEQLKDGMATVTTETDYETNPGPKAPVEFAAVRSRGEKCAGKFTFDTRTGRLDKFEDTLVFTQPPPPPAARGGNVIITGATCNFRYTYTVTAKPPKKAE